MSALIDISNPAVCRYDASVNLYFFDSINYRIRRIDPNGIITTVAGNGQYSVAGLNAAGPATSTAIGEVFDLAIDPSGNIFFSESNDNRIFRISVAGKLEVFLQLPPTDPLEPTFTPVATDSQGNVYFFSETLFPLTLLEATPPESSPPSRRSPPTRRLRRAWNPTSPAISTRMSTASYCAMRHFFLQPLRRPLRRRFRTCTIRKISAGVLSTFAGTGTCGSGPPSGNAKTANL